MAAIIIAKAGSTVTTATVEIQAVQIDQTVAAEHQLQHQLRLQSLEPLLLRFFPKRVATWLVALGMLSMAGFGVYVFKKFKLI